MQNTHQNYSEKELVEACSTNNRKAQEHLYRQYFNKMNIMVKRYTDDEDEQISIINNGFLRVFQKINTFRFEGSFEGWIRRCIYHSMVDYMKTKERNRVALVELEPEFETVRSEGEDNLFEEDLLAIMNKLPTATKTVFELFAIGGYSHKEIGEKLGISEGTSKWHVSSAREKLTQLLTDFDKIKKAYAR